MTKHEELFDVVIDMVLNAPPATALARSGTVGLVLRANRSDGYAWRSKNCTQPHLLFAIIRDTGEKFGLG